MAADTVSIMGIFSSERSAADAIDGLRETPWTIERVHSPIPSHAIEETLELPKSRVGWFTLAGGIIGFFTGFFLAAFTATRWSLIVGGKPVVALVPFFIVGFEFTILFSVFGNVIGLINVGGLPDWEGLAAYDPRCSGEHYGITAACAPDQTADLRRELRHARGGHRPGDRYFLDQGPLLGGGHHHRRGRRLRRHRGGQRCEDAEQRCARCGARSAAAHPGGDGVAVAHQTLRGG